MRVTGDELADRFDATLRVEFEPTYNAAPGQELPVVRGNASENSKTVESLRWGLVPSWADDNDGHINARAETVADKPSFADAYEKRRCLVPADGFYEWTDEGPWYVEFDGVAALAGIWEQWVPERRQAGLDSFGGDDGGRKEELGPRELDVDVRRVSDRVNSPENDDASLVEEIPH